MQLAANFKHLSRFSMVGVLNTLVDFLVFTVLQEVLGAGYILSQVAGYGCGVVNSFILNKKWTFGEISSGKKQLYEFIQFAVVNLTSLSITLVAMNFMVKDINLNLYLSKVIVTILAQITNFTLYKFWVFK